MQQDTPKRIMILFPGYGSHFGLRGKDVYESSRQVQEYFEEAAVCVQAPVLKWAFAASEVELSDPFEGYVMSALLGIMYATALRERLALQSVALSGCVGVGMGLLPALHTAKVLSLPDMLYIARKVAEFYQTYLSEHNCAAVALAEKPKKFPDGVVAGGTLPDGSLRLVGSRSALESLCDTLKENGAACRELPIEAGLFAPSVGDTIVEQLRVYLEKIDLHSAELPIMRFDTAEFVSGDEMREYLAQCMALPIDWKGMLKEIAREADLVIVVGNAPELATQLQEKVSIPVELVTGLSDIERVAQRCAQREHGNE